MNERGREVLVHAALSGEEQTFFVYHDLGTKGDCAVGKLHIAMHGHRDNFCQTVSEVVETFELVGGFRVCDICSKRTGSELTYIEHLNDEHYLDFLTIARKV